jgi:hypothetical protein
MHAGLWVAQPHDNSYQRVRDSCGRQTRMPFIRRRFKSRPGF